MEVVKADIFVWQCSIQYRPSQQINFQSESYAVSFRERLVKEAKSSGECWSTTFLSRQNNLTRGQPSFTYLCKFEKISETTSGDALNCRDRVINLY